MPERCARRSRDALHHRAVRQRARLGRCSVVPLFREQIRARRAGHGHASRRCTRYFMTIPEAVPADPAGRRRSGRRRRESSCSTWASRSRIQPSRRTDDPPEPARFRARDIQIVVHRLAPRRKTVRGTVPSAGKLRSGTSARQDFPRAAAQHGLELLNARWRVRRRPHSSISTRMRCAAASLLLPDARGATTMRATVVPLARSS